MLSGFELYARWVPLTIVQFCPTVGESLLASGQPIPRQRKVIVLSSVSLVSFCTILKAPVMVTSCEIL